MKKEKKEINGNLGRGPIMVLETISSGCTSNDSEEPNIEIVSEVNYSTLRDEFGDMGGDWAEVWSIAINEGDKTLERVQFKFDLYDEDGNFINEAKIITLPEMKPGEARTVMIQLKGEDYNPVVTQAELRFVGLAGAE